MEAHRRIKVIVIALRGMHRFRYSQLLGRFAEHLQRAPDIELFQRILGRKRPAQRGNAERTVWIGVARCVP